MKNTFNNSTETRRLHREDLQALCIKNKWYTTGTHEEYTLLLNKCNAENITSKIIVTMANDIAYHSRLDIDHKYVEHIKNIACQIAKTCYSYFDNL